MANVRDSDTSLWLHNKLGTSNDSWISGSICSQLNKEVLRNIKECFSDLQTQVKLKLLLSFFHIPRRLVEEWKTELDEIIEVAGLDTELWVSMLAETMKTFPASSSLNTEISEYEDNRPIFTDMVNDLRKLVSKHCDIGMLPLECQYLNKNPLVSVVGQQTNPIKHFTLKRKPKSATLRQELLHKSADAQSSLKKATAPTIPLRSRGMPRKMTDTTPLKGIPSRVPTTGGFRSPNIGSTIQQRPNLSRTSAGRKDGGIKLIEFTDQPLGYAAAKKRKREQQLEEQQKKMEQKQQQSQQSSAASLPISEEDGNLKEETISNIQKSSNFNSNTFNIKNELNQSNGNPVDESLNDNSAKDETPDLETIKIERKTPDYAASLSSTGDFHLLGNNSITSTPGTSVITQTNPRSGMNVGVKPAPVIKTNGRTVKATTAGGTKSSRSARKTQASKANAANTTSSINNNNNIEIGNVKRIKQEIEIKSEEIIVPPNIKVEKIELPVQLEQPHQDHIQSLTVSSQKQRNTQRIIIQQQTQQQIPQQISAVQKPQQHQLKLNTHAPNTQQILLRSSPQKQQNKQQSVTMARTPIKVESQLLKSSTSSGTILTQQQLRQVSNPLAHLPNNISVKITSTKSSQEKTGQPQQHQQSQQSILINNNTPVILSGQTLREKSSTIVTGTTGSTITTANAQTIKSMPLSQLKSAANSGPVIISQTIIQPAKRNSVSQQPTAQQSIQTSSNQQQPATTKYIITSTPTQQQQQQNQCNVIPSLTFNQPTRQIPQTTTLYQQGALSQTGTPTKIVLKTSPGSGVVMTPVRQQQQQQPQQLVSTMLNVQLPNRPVTIQPASQAAQQQHLQAQLQQQQQHTMVSNTTATQQPKLTQMIVQTSGAGNCGASTSLVGNTAKNNTLILTQKGFILKNIGGELYQQIPIKNVSGLQGLNSNSNVGTTTTLMTNAAGPPTLVKTQSQIQLQSANKSHHIPTLVPTNSINSQHVIVQQPSPSTSIIGTPPQQTIIRPVISNVQGGLTTLPQGLTLIQRPGQQPQLLQVQAPQSGQQQQATIITQTPVLQNQIRPQIVLQQRPTTVQQHIATTHTNQQAANNIQQVRIQRSMVQLPKQQIQQKQQLQTTSHAQQQQSTPQRRGLSLSNEHVHKAHEMFRKANRVSRPDKALILGFMAGLRENPRPNSENVIIIKLGDSEEKVQQEDGSTSMCIVESFIRLDYNTGEWKTFQNYRRLDQTTTATVHTNSVGGSTDNSSVMQPQSSVVI